MSEKKDWHTSKIVLKDKLSGPNTSKSIKEKSHSKLCFSHFTQRSDDCLLHAHHPFVSEKFLTFLSNGHAVM